MRAGALTAELVSLMCLLSGLSLAAQPSPPSPVTVALTVTDRAGVERTGWPVVSGIPFPRGAVREELITRGHFRVVDADGREVPSQATVAATWGRYPEGSTGHVKWMRLVFLADVPARSPAKYFLELGRGIRNTAETAMTVGRREDSVSVVTGRTARGDNLRVHFEVSATGVIRAVELHREGDGFQPADRTASDLITLVYLHQGERHEIDTTGLDWNIETEYSGPVETVVKATAKLDERMELLMRIYLYAAWPVLHVQPTLIYRGKPTRDVDFVELEEFSYSLSLGEDPGGPRSVGMGVGEAYPNTPGGVFESDRRLVLEQDVSHHFQRDNTDDAGLCKAFFYEVHAGEVGDPDPPVARGSRSPGWVMVRDDKLSVVGWCRYFWQLFPKRIVADGRRITYQLWARGAQLQPEGCSRFYKGMAKTHDLFFRFDGEPLPEQKAQAFAAALGDELIAVCDPEYYCRTRAYGPHPLSPAVGRGGRRHPGYDALVRACLNREFEGRLGLYPSRERNDAYGFINFGDWLLSRYWASHEYDTTWGFLQQFYRTGDLELLDYVREAARHSYDIDFHHDADITTSKYPQTSHDKGNYHFQGGDSHGHTGEADPGHVFVDGLLNYYWLTGDLRCGDVLDWAFPLYLAEQKERLAGGGTWRYVGGYVVGIYVRGYAWTWDPAYIEQAEWAVGQNFYPERPGRGNATRHPSDGVWWDKRQKGYSCQPWLGDSVVDGYSALLEVHPVTRHRERLEDAFVQIARFVDEHAFTREQGGIWQGLSKPGLGPGPYTHSKGNYGRGICGLSALTMGKAYELKGDPHFLDVGRELLSLVVQTRGELYHGKEISQALHYTPMLLHYLDTASQEGGTSPR